MPHHAPLFQEASAECEALRGAHAGLEAALQRCAAGADREVAELREALDDARQRAAEVLWFPGYVCCYGYILVV